MRLNAVGGNPARTKRPTKAATRRDQYEGYETARPGTPPTMPGSTRPKERRKPAVETDLGGLFDFHQDETKDAVRCLLKNRALASTTPSRRRRLSVVVSEAANRPSDEGRERRNHEYETAERRRLRRPRPVYPKKRAPGPSEAARPLGQRSGEVRRLGPHIQRPKLPKLNVRPEKPKRPPLWFRPPRLPGVKGP